jgi:hypothetical protein
MTKGCCHPISHQQEATLSGQAAFRGISTEQPLTPGWLIGSATPIRVTPGHAMSV